MDPFASLHDKEKICFSQKKNTKKFYEICFSFRRGVETSNPLRPKYLCSGKTMYFFTTAVVDLVGVGTIRFSWGGPGLEN